MKKFLKADTIRKKEVEMKKTILALGFFLALTACGKRGRLDFPPGSRFTVQTYPAPHDPVQKDKAVSDETEEDDAPKNVIGIFEKLEREADEK